MRVTTEFFDQGHREVAEGLPLTPLCDWSQSRVKSQGGFIQVPACRRSGALTAAQFVTKPLFKGLSPFFPALEECIAHMDANVETWKTYTDERLLEEVPEPVRY